jgi:hypothetical protein
LGREEEVQALKRLDNQARQLERTATGPSFEAFAATERDRSGSLGGRSVFGLEADLASLEDRARTKIQVGHAQSLRLGCARLGHLAVVLGENPAIGPVIRMRPELFRRMSRC